MNYTNRDDSSDICLKWLIFIDGSRVMLSLTKPMPVIKYPFWVTTIANKYLLGVQNLQRLEIRLEPADGASEVTLPSGSHVFVGSVSTPCDKVYIISKYFQPTKGDNHV
jgi:hypothetical protein